MALSDVEGSRAQVGIWDTSCVTWQPLLDSNTEQSVILAMHNLYEILKLRMSALAGKSSILSQKNECGSTFTGKQHNKLEKVQAGQAARDS
jgi:hypothetical protein